MSAVQDVVVLGAGPAGAAAALGLARLGATVAMIGRPRAPTVEGLSARTVARLTAAGLHLAAAEANVSTPRFARWAGESAVRGAECLIRRERFDAALQEDLRGGGIDVQNRVANALSARGEIWEVGTAEGPILARSVIDARGRRARRAEIRGPSLMAITALYDAATTSAPGSAVLAVEDGWCWIARTDGRVWVQFIGAPDSCVTHEGLAAHVAAAAAAAASDVPEFDLSPRSIRRVDARRTQGRAAVARFSKPAQARGVLRIGDAAVAMDPLSGHGIYEALGSAQVAVAALNTYLSGAEWTPIARFVDERAAEIWRRGLAAAGDFYRRQASHARTSFWQGTAARYETLAAAAGPRDNGPGRFEWRGVLNGQRIELRPVWVSPAWPRGIWHVQGREIAVAGPATGFIQEVPR